MKSFLTIKEIREKLDKKKITPKEVFEFYKKRIEKFNPKLNAILEVFEEGEFSKKEHSQTGKLFGVPGILKDNICYKDHITSCSSKILSNYKAPYNATTTKRLKEEGAIIIGRGNMDEFAMGASGEFSAFEPTLNPWDLSRSPGGSSSGSGAAVAAGLVPWAIGTESGGSVRTPASFCNLVGLYPTYGLFSRNGLVAFTSSTDQPGPLTKTVYDNALITSIISGHDPYDGTSIPQPKQDYTQNLTGKFPENLVIGVIRDSLESEGVNPQVKTTFEKVVKHLKNLGAKIKHVTLPSLKYGIAVFFVISRAEAASNLYRFDGSLYGLRKKDVKTLKELYIKTRHDNLGKEIKRRILMGNYVLSSSHKDTFYDKAQLVRSLIRTEFNQAFKEVNLLISPTTPTLPFKIGRESLDPLALYMADYFTVPMCIAGIPSLSLPCGFSKENLPIGFQFTGPRLSEKLIYQVAYVYEQNTDHHLKNPPGF